MENDISMNEVLLREGLKRHPTATLVLVKK